MLIKIQAQMWVFAEPRSMPRATIINGIKAKQIIAKAPRPGVLCREVNTRFQATNSTANAASETRLIARLMRKRGSSQFSSGSGLGLFLATRLLQLLGKLR